jgi:hypothetical protein
MNILDHISESLVTICRVKILQFFDAGADPDRGSGNPLTLDPGSGMEKIGFGIIIPDPQLILRGFFGFLLTRNLYFCSENQLLFTASWSPNLLKCFFFIRALLLCWAKKMVIC